MSKVRLGGREVVSILKTIVARELWVIGVELGRRKAKWMPTCEKERAAVLHQAALLLPEYLAESSSGGTFRRGGDSLRPGRWWDMIILGSGNRLDVFITRLRVNGSQGAME